jgi:methyl-accepting chemotaxis protein
VAAGDLSRACAETGPDEVARIATAVNAAVRAITRSIDAVQGAATREKHQAGRLDERIQGMLTLVTAVTDGDLTVEVPVDGDDALADLGRALHRLTADLHENMNLIAANARGLSTASDELRASSDHMATNSEAASTHAASVSAGAADISANVTTVATSAGEMSASPEVRRRPPGSQRLPWRWPRPRT